MESPRHDQLHHNNTPTSPSPEMFSFPGTPNTDDDQSEFEFGSCIAPDSPPLITISDHMSKTNSNNNSSSTVQFSTSSPADQFFLNGRLLPHDFPVVHSSRTSFSGRDNMGPTTIAAVTLSRGTSNKSSSSSSSSHPSSKDYSLVSSRSNSTNSTCSTCASSSNNTTTKNSSCDKKPFQKRMMRSVKERSSPLGQYYKYGASGSSQRWQFITAVPVLGRTQSVSQRGRKESGSTCGGKTTSPKTTRDVGCKEKRGSSNNSGNHESLFHKILRSVVATCKACHAMECQENEFELDAPTHVIGH